MAMREANHTGGGGGRSRPSGRPAAACLRRRGEELPSLAATGLSAHFYSWPGVSGRRYVCSVFRRGEETLLIGLSQAIIIGVVRKGKERWPRRLLLTQETTDETALRLLEETATLGVDEWHVHFGASEIALHDLAGLLGG